MSDPRAGIAEAAERLARARAELQEAVDRARAHGVPWADVGRTLGISRQAAFKRFGHPPDPRRRQPMSPRALSDAVEVAELALREIARGDYPALRSRMPDEVAAELTEERVLGTWAAVVAEIGALEELDATTLESPDGTPLDPGDSALGLVVADTTVRCEAGEIRARVALDGADRVVGLLLVDPGAADLPF